MSTRTRFEEFKVTGDELLAQARKLLHEGNVRRLIVKNEAGDTLVEVPLYLSYDVSVVPASRRREGRQPMAEESR